MTVFSLEKALANNGKCRTREGRPARIICTDRKHPHPLVVLILGPYDYESVVALNLDGRYHTHLNRSHPEDLVNCDDE